MMESSQVLVPLLAMAAVVYLDPARESLKTATVIVYAISLMIAVLMQIHYVLDQCLTVQYQVYT